MTAPQDYDCGCTIACPLHRLAPEMAEVIAHALDLAERANGGETFPSAVLIAAYNRASDALREAGVR